MKKDRKNFALDEWKREKNSKRKVMSEFWEVVFDIGVRALPFMFFLVALCCVLIGLGELLTEIETRENCSVIETTDNAEPSDYSWDYFWVYYYMNYILSDN